MRAFLHFGGSACGSPNGPFETIEVEVKEVPLLWQVAGLTWTATGYGPKIATRYLVRFNNRWRRVYAACFGNGESLYLVDAKSKGWLCTVDIDLQSRIQG